MVDTKRLENIAWHFVTARIQTTGGIILQKEIYERVIKEDLSEIYKEGYIEEEYGRGFETLDWVNYLIPYFDIDDSLRDALGILENFIDASVSPIGSEILENQRTLIKNTVLIDIVEKISLKSDQYHPGKMMVEYFWPEEKDVIPIIKNFLKTL